MWAFFKHKGRFQTNVHTAVDSDFTYETYNWLLKAFKTPVMEKLHIYHR